MFTEIYDAEAAMAQRNEVVRIDPILVRAAVRNDFRHSRDQGFIPPGYARYAAHD